MNLRLNSISWRMIVGLNTFFLWEGLFGQISGEFWGLTRYQTIDRQASKSEVRLRYLPELAWELGSLAAGRVDLELSADLRGGIAQGTTTERKTITVLPYRLWVRYRTVHLEARLGLQKIVFGPARLLRPLIWFDRLDPRDPLQVTTGVYGLRIRYDFLSNANLWGWGLYGNTDLRGWDLFPTRKRQPEWGARGQIPAGPGELAVTLHHREVELPFDEDPHHYTSENRLALDGMWDVGPGVWFEWAVNHWSATDSLPQWQSLLTVGSDYTFGLGNGLTVTGELFNGQIVSAPGETREQTLMSAFMLSYPLGIMDQLLAFCAYSPTEHFSYYYISYQRTYDRWLIHVSGYWSPETPKSPTGGTGLTFGFRGVQVMVAFNH